MKVNQKDFVSANEESALTALGALLKVARIQQSFTQEAIAERADMSRQTVARIERGDPSVAIGQVMRYAHLVSLEAFTSFPAAEPQRAARVRVKKGLSAVAV